MPYKFFWFCLNHYWFMYMYTCRSCTLSEAAEHFETSEPIILKAKYNLNRLWTYPSSVLGRLVSVKVPHQTPNHLAKQNPFSTEMKSPPPPKVCLGRLQSPCHPPLPPSPAPCLCDWFIYTCSSCTFFKKYNSKRSKDFQMLITLFLLITKL